MPKSVLETLEEVTQLLAPIVTARDEYAETGRYPPSGDGPGPDQGFDDWAADIAEKCVFLLIGATYEEGRGWSK